jgi:decaprenylphospho-beta-D-erythro-pentofuranosid-2-ulose 2-reductase
MSEPKLQRVLVIGATSGIARALSAVLAEAGYGLMLAGRDAGELERIAQDLRLRHAVDVETVNMDLDEPRHSLLVIDTCAQGGLYGVVIAAGYLGEQARANTDESEMLRVLNINYVAPAAMLNRLARHFEQTGEGFIIGVGSVAGDRGRQSNYHYGAAKGALALYLQGLRNRLQPAGVPVLTVKPGFVDTAMTWGLPGMFLVASPEDVARGIYRALRRRRNVVYLPWFWRWIMLIIRSVPEFVFKRLKL